MCKLPFILAAYFSIAITACQLRADVTVFDTVEDLRIALGTLSEGDHVATRGYHAPDDGGNAGYNITMSKEEDDGGSVISTSPNPSTPELQARLKANGMVNVRQFGAKSDYLAPNGNTDNTRAFQNAISFAQAQAKNVFIPAGRYLCRKQLAGGIMLISSSIEIIGAGRDATFLKMGNHTDDPDVQTEATFKAIEAIGTGVTVAFRHLTIEGPLQNDVPSNSGDVIRCSFDPGSDSTVVIEDCYLNSDVVAVKVSFSGNNLEVYHSRLRARIQGILMSTTGYEGGYCHVFDSTFEMTPDSAAGEHCIYTNEGVSVWVDRCRFLTMGGFGVKLKGDRESALDPPPLPEYLRIANSYFTNEPPPPEAENQNSGSGILTHPYVPARITNCTFHSTHANANGIAVSYGGANVTQCHFFGQGATCISDYQSANSVAYITDCIFETLAPAAQIVRRNWSEKRWTITNCQFDNPDGANCIQLIGNEEINVTVGTDPELEQHTVDTGWRYTDTVFENCTFRRCEKAQIMIKGGNLIARGNHMDGDAEDAIEIHAEDDVTLTLIDNEFGARRLFLITAERSYIQVVSAGNTPEEWIEAFPFLFKDEAGVAVEFVEPPLAADLLDQVGHYIDGISQPNGDCPPVENVVEGGIILVNANPRGDIEDCRGPIEVSFYGHGNSFDWEVGARVSEKLDLSKVEVTGHMRLRESRAPDLNPISDGSLEIREGHNLYHVRVSLEVRIITITIGPFGPFGPFRVSVQVLVPGSIEHITMGGDAHKLFQGPVHLVVAGSWKIVSTGNIKPKTEAVRADGEVVTLIYDSVDGVWREL